MDIPAAVNRPHMGPFLIFVMSAIMSSTILLTNVNAHDPNTATVAASATDSAGSTQHHHNNGLKNPNHLRYDMVSDVQIECNSDNIMVTMNTMNNFNGMIYPKGLSKNSSCMVEYHSTSNVTYLLPLRSCNTMSTDVEDGIEYFNTVMVQPHRRLVTNQGRGYHIRCRYQTKEKTISSTNGQQFNVNLTNTTPVVASASMPSCTMKIFSANDLTNEVVAENVKIGDKLQLIIQLEYQDVYGMTVTNCLVRDGLNWGEQPLVNDYGCPVDEEIMPEFTYSHNLTRAQVTFQAHKFPYTSSVYYQCNVRLCIREGGCDNVPPDCSQPNQVRRKKRYVEGGEIDGVASEDLLRPKSAEVRDMSMEVYSGLHVNENEASASGGSDTNNNNKDSTSESGDADGIPVSPNKQAQQAQQEFCISMRKFAIAVSLISLLLMLAVITLVACILQRRKRKREAANAAALAANRNASTLANGSSIYSRPYSNKGYSRE